MHTKKLKDISLPEQIENQFIDFIKYANTFNDEKPNLLLVGFSIITLPLIVQALANEIGITFKFVDSRIFEELVF